MIPKMSAFTLTISCLATSNLPWFMGLTFQVSMQYCSLQHQILLPSQSHPQLGVVFALTPLFILSEVQFSSVQSLSHVRLFATPWIAARSPLISSGILGTYRPGVFIFQCLIFLPFHTVHVVLKARILKWSAIPFSSEPDFVRTLHHDSSILGGHAWHGSQFHWVRQGCVWSMWSDWLVFCDCGFQFVCPLMEKVRGLWKLPDWRDWLRGKLGLVLMGGVILSKSLI